MEKINGVERSTVAGNSVLTSSPIDCGPPLAELQPHECGLPPTVLPRQAVRDLVNDLTNLPLVRHRVETSRLLSERQKCISLEQLSSSYLNHEY